MYTYTTVYGYTIWLHRLAHTNAVRTRVYIIMCVVHLGPVRRSVAHSNVDSYDNSIIMYTKSN